MQTFVNKSFCDHMFHFWKDNPSTLSQIEAKGQVFVSPAMDKGCPWGQNATVGEADPFCQGKYPGRGSVGATTGTACGWSGGGTWVVYHHFPEDVFSYLTSCFFLCFLLEVL